ncbi:MAG: EamA family transporter [Thermoplasmata archaeon]|nr:EamA family transporter [Thermoplasmata archaeon]
MDRRWSYLTWVLFAVLVVSWGLNYLWVEVGLTSAGPLWLATLRSGVGLAGTLVLVTIAGGWGTLEVKDRRDAALLGIPNTALFFGLWFVAARSVPPGIASILVYSFPLWIALLSAPVLGRPLRRTAWAAITIGFIGVALISQVWSLTGSGVALVPVVELLLGALSWAVGTVLFQRRFHATQVLAANTYQLAGGFLVLLLATLALGGEPLPRPTPDLLAATLWLGIVGTAVAYSIWYTLLGQTSAARVSAYLFLVPVVALVASALLLDERLVWIQLVGVGLVLLAIFGVGRSRMDLLPRAPGSTVRP